MTCKLKIHPCDLQDKDGFLRFLHENAVNGLNVVWVVKSFSIFKTAKAGETARYTMLFPCISDRKGNLCIMGNGLGIFNAKAAASEAKTDEWETALTLRWSLTLCLILILCILFARSVYELSHAMAMSASEILRLLFPHASRGLIFSIIGLLCFSLFSCFLEYRTDQMHKAGLSQAAACGVAYHQPPSRGNMIYAKNLLCTLRAFLVSAIYLLLLYLLA